jgi:hypothetical protein
MKKTFVAVLCLIVAALISAVVGLRIAAPRLREAERSRFLTRDAALALRQATEHYTTEYGSPPQVGDGDFWSDDPSGVQFVAILMGLEEGAPVRNFRRIPFLNIKQPSKPRGGLFYDGDRVVGIYDGWGQPLRIFLRPPGEAAITFEHRGMAVTLSAPAVVISKGPDQIEGTDDDITSWDD